MVNSTSPDADIVQSTGDATVDAMVQRFTVKREELEVDRYFRALVKLEGSDLHMKVGQPPWNLSAPRCFSPPKAMPNMARPACIFRPMANGGGPPWAWLVAIPFSSLSLKAKLH